MKVYVQMDYLQNQGADYLSASYRDFVPEAIEIKEVVKEHLKAVVSRSERIKEITRGITNLEAIATQPIRTFIEYQIEEGIKATPSYFALRDRGLHVRKQTFLQYFNAIKKGWRREPEETIPEHPEEEGYDDTALTTIHAWLARELQHAFSGWSIEEDYDVYEAEEFTAPYKTRTFEFGLMRTARADPEDVRSFAYNYIAFNENAVQAYKMWRGFDYMGFNREIRRIGAWK